MLIERINDAPIHSNLMMSLDVVRLFTKVPTDETFAVVWDKLATDPSLEERTCIPIDDHMKMFHFLCGDNLLEDGIWYIPTRRRTGYGFAIVTSIGQTYTWNISKKWCEDLHLCGLDT